MTLQSPAPLLGAIEAGGTKFVLALARGPEDIVERELIPTSDPKGTLDACIEWFNQAQDRHGRMEALGVGSFGPLDLDPSSPSFGDISSTPKPGWLHTPLLRRLKAAFAVPVAIDTDVNAAALAEARWGVGVGLDPLVYITVGTGIGGGVLVHGNLLHGALHPEIGHLMVPDPQDGAPQPEGQCPYHRNCVEGYACGPAIEKRWGRPAPELPADHPAWTGVARSLAHACANLCLTLSPRRIILGGGVMQTSGLLEKVRHQLSSQLNGYLRIPELHDQLDSFLCAPGLGTHSGLYGALALAKNSLHDQAAVNPPTP